MSNKKLSFAGSGKQGEKEEAEEVKKIVIDAEGFKKSLQTVLDFQNEYNITLLYPKGLKQARVIVDRLSKDSKLRQFVTEEIGKQITPIRQQIVANNEKIDKLMEMLSTITGPKKRKIEQKEVEEQTQPTEGST
jgi:hypothetical protein